MWESQFQSDTSNLVLFEIFRQERSPVDGAVECEKRRSLLSLPRTLIAAARCVFSTHSHTAPLQASKLWPQMLLSFGEQTMLKICEEKGTCFSLFFFFVCIASRAQNCDWRELMKSPLPWHPSRAAAGNVIDSRWLSSPTTGRWRARTLACPCCFAGVLPALPRASLP